jgi:hypothetical protein
MGRGLGVRLGRCGDGGLGGIPSQNIRDWRCRQHNQAKSGEATDGSAGGWGSDTPELHKIHLCWVVRLFVILRKGQPIP